MTSTENRPADGAGLKTNFTPATGQEVYLEDGRRAIFAGVIGGQNFVRVLLYSDEEYGREEWPSDKLTPVSRVFEREPCEAYGPRIAEMIDEIERLKESRDAARASVLDLKKQAAEIERSVKKHPDLSLAIDFLEGRITHVVVEGYFSFEIKTLADVLEQRNDYGRIEGLKLLNLFGTDSSGKTRWVVNRYYDGSGSNTTVIPFRCLADAEAYIREAHQAALIAWRSGDAKHGAHAFLKCPVELEWPDDFMAELKAQKIKNAQHTIEHFRKQMAPYEAELAALQEARDGQ